MSKRTPTPSTTTLQYVGGLSPVFITFPATGRSFTVATGEVLDLLQSEADGLKGRPDFATPTPTTPDTEETPS